MNSTIRLTRISWAAHELLLRTPQGQHSMAVPLLRLGNFFVPLRQHELHRYHIEIQRWTVVGNFFDKS